MMTLSKLEGMVTRHNDELRNRYKYARERGFNSEEAKILSHYTVETITRLALERKQKNG